MNSFMTSPEFIYILPQSEKTYKKNFHRRERESNSRPLRGRRVYKPLLHESLPTESPLNSLNYI